MEFWTGLGSLEAIVLDRTPNPGISSFTNAIPGSIPTTRAIMLQEAGTGHVTTGNGNIEFVAMNTTSKACDSVRKEGIFLVAMDTASKVLDRSRWHGINQTWCGRFLHMAGGNKDGGSRSVQIDGGRRCCLIEGGFMVAGAVIVQASAGAVIVQASAGSVCGRMIVTCFMVVI
ncbi:hypothetical protein A2U01_0017622, partial [Trifolium medium]|nr:hypothetical protein [Trifolium medium]